MTHASATALMPLTKTILGIDFRYKQRVCIWIGGSIFLGKYYSWDSVSIIIECSLILALIVLLGTCTTLFLLCLYLYYQNRNLFRRIRWYTDAFTFCLIPLSQEQWGLELRPERQVPHQLVHLAGAGWAEEQHQQDQQHRPRVQEDKSS